MLSIFNRLRRSFSQNADETFFYQKQLSARKWNFQFKALFYRSHHKCWLRRWIQVLENLNPQKVFSEHQFKFMCSITGKRSNNVQKIRSLFDNATKRNHFFKVTKRNNFFILKFDELGKNYGKKKEFYPTSNRKMSISDDNFLSAVEFRLTSFLSIYSSIELLLGSTKLYIDEGLK